VGKDSLSNNKRKTTKPPTKTLQSVPSSYRQLVSNFAATVSLLRVFAIVIIAIGILVFFAAPKNSDFRIVAINPISQIQSHPDSSPKKDATQEVLSSNEEAISNPRIPILYYHYVEINPDPTHDPGRDALLITPENFEDQLLYLKDHGYTTITLDDVVRGIEDPSTLPTKPIVLTVDDGYTDFYTNAFPIIKKTGVKVTLFALSRGDKVKPGFYLSGDQLKEISRSPLITIACHTEDHPVLKGHSDAFQHEQIFGCKSQMENLIGMPVRHFAYPYGSFDNTTVRLVKEAGYETASSTMGGTHQSAKNIYQLRRLHVGNYGGAHLESILKSLP
jgi:peptidoglycan/xylan/chitin deacetylase (PgdA/CDA1 family)